MSSAIYAPDHEANEQNLLVTSIKVENETDEELSYDGSSQINNQNDHLVNLTSTSTAGLASLSSTYKGKIEVTSKGRRKIFDGVRWQILCRRAECRKQTNKKSLCITHYKEEYELANARSSSSCPNNLSTLHLRSYRQRHPLDSAKTRQEVEDQNSTITTTDRHEQHSSMCNPRQSTHEGQMEHLENGGRFILKNSKWQPMCNYDHTCRNIAKYDSLCIKHYELAQEKRRNPIKCHSHDKQRIPSTLFDKHRSVFTNGLVKRLKTTNDFQISSSPVTEQFDINSREDLHTSIEPVENNSCSLTSKLPGYRGVTSSQNHLRSPLLDKPRTTLQHDQSVQTDLSVPLCCIIHHSDHSVSSTCKNHKSTSSFLSIHAKSEPQCFETNFSTSHFL